MVKRALAMIAVAVPGRGLDAPPVTLYHTK